MPRLDLSGFEELAAAFDKISNVPEDVQMKALTAMEEVAASEIRKSGEAYGVRDPESPVHVLDSIKVNKPKKTDSGGYADVTFSGSRIRSGKQVRQAEIAFINEYGKKNQQARPFVGEAMNKNAEAIAKAGAEVILDWTENNF